MPVIAFMCKICSKIYTTRESFLDHKRSHFVKPEPESGSELEDSSTQSEEDFPLQNGNYDIGNNEVQEKQEGNESHSNDLDTLEIHSLETQEMETLPESSIEIESPSVSKKSVADPTDEVIEVVIIHDPDPAVHFQSLHIPENNVIDISECLPCGDCIDETESNSESSALSFERRNEVISERKRKGNQSEPGTEGNTAKISVLAYKIEMCSQQDFAETLEEDGSLNLSTLDPITNVGPTPTVDVLNANPDRKRVKLEPGITGAGKKASLCTFCRVSVDPVHCKLRRTGNKEIPISCEDCKPIYTDLQIIIRNKFGEKRFACSACKTELKSKPSLITHFRCHTKMPSWTCFRPKIEKVETNLDTDDTNLESTDNQPKEAEDRMQPPASGNSNPASNIETKTQEIFLTRDTRTNWSLRRLSLNVKKKMYLQQHLDQNRNQDRIREIDREEHTKALKLPASTATNVKREPNGRFARANSDSS